jgi:hypothetical protein
VGEQPAFVMKEVDEEQIGTTQTFKVLHIQVVVFGMNTSTIAPN